LSRFLVIGGAGLLGAEVVKALGAGQCLVAWRLAGERVDIADPKSLAALLDRVGEVDGIVCTGGAARFKPWDHLTDDDWAFSLASKLMGQINVVRLGANRVRHGGATTLTPGLGGDRVEAGGQLLSLRASRIVPATIFCSGEVT
jgi:NAD(P)-dependent dehydrogenase (short-subunit alcohol dehydrogenase family)